MHSHKKDDKQMQAYKESTVMLQLNVPTFG